MVTVVLHRPNTPIMGPSRLTREKGDKQHEIKIPNANHNTMLPNATILHHSHWGLMLGWLGFALVWWGLEILGAKMHNSRDSYYNWLRISRQVYFMTLEHSVLMPNSVTMCNPLAEGLFVLLLVLLLAGFAMSWTNREIHLSRWLSGTNNCLYCVVL